MHSSSHACLRELLLSYSFSLPFPCHTTASATVPRHAVFRAILFTQPCDRCLILSNKENFTLCIQRRKVLQQTPAKGRETQTKERCAFMLARAPFCVANLIHNSCKTFPTPDSVVLWARQLRKRKENFTMNHPLIFFQLSFAIGHFNFYMLWPRGNARMKVTNIHEVQDYCKISCKSKVCTIN